MRRAGRALAAAATLFATPAPARVAVAPYGVTAQGAAVHVYTLVNGRGARARILDYGGIVTELTMPDRKGRLASVVLALPSLAAYEKRANFGSIIGRVANRTSGGGFTLDGVRYALAGGKDGISSHGGPGGFSTKIWRAKLLRSGVRLSYVSPDGENGYPGALSVTVTYRLTDANTFRIDYRATTTRPTVVNLTNHSFFNLAGGGTVADQTIKIAAEAWTPTNARRVPTGEIRAVAGTPFDLRRPVRIGARWNDPALVATNGFDQNFVLAKPPGRLAVAARAADPASGRTMTVTTTEPGVQFYTAGMFDGSLIGATGPLGRGAGFALETQHFPDGPNRPEFPSIVLRPGQVFRSTTIYRFGVTP